MRDNFNKQLEHLNGELTAMGALCEEAIQGAARCLLEKDSDRAAQVFGIEAQIGHKERDIESLCMKLMLLQQPVARDLRNISSALKMISDMERIGDQAADIAETARYVQGYSVPSNLHIAEMANAARKMVKDSVDSFVRRDLEAARAVTGYDDVVDSLFLMVKRELTDLICQDPGEGELYLDLLMVAKYLERIGDHAANIAGWVEFSITGTHRDS